MPKAKKKLNNILGEGDLQAIERTLKVVFFKHAAANGYGHEWIRIDDGKFQREFGQQVV